jgi:murein L,D-transpeptidase YafK
MKALSGSHARRLATLTAVMLGLAVVAPLEARAGKADVPVPSATQALMAARDMDPRAPILIRAYKKESELEVWKQTRAGRYVHLKTFPICRWSGQLGPKRKTGDRQTPEGFYTIPAAKMNPNSSYHLSFDLGYPNEYDRAHGGSGSFLMTHGSCSSMGCYAMTDAQISEIYALARDALAAGQRAFQFQAYPFRMNAANMAKARTEEHIEFWRQLKEGADRFEATGEELAVGVSAGRYTFARSRNAAREEAAQARITEEKAKIAKLVEDGAGAVRTTYSDGGMHASFASLLRRGSDVGPVSRPEALALAGREIITIAARRKPAPILVAAKPAPANEARIAVAPLVPALGAASGTVQTLFARAPYQAGATFGVATAMPGSARILSASLVIADAPLKRPLDKLAAARTP